MLSATGGRSSLGPKPPLHNLPPIDECVDPPKLPLELRTISFPAPPSYTITPCSPPSPPTFVKSTIQPTALPDHPPVSPFLDPQSLLISCSPLRTNRFPLFHLLF